MNKKFGIDYDKWHGILAFIVMLAVFAISALFFKPKYIGNDYALTLCLGLTVLIAFFITTYLQALNEAIQAIDKKMVDKYGFLENFQIDSKADWKYCFLGILFGVPLGVFVWAII